MSIAKSFHSFLQLAFFQIRKRKNLYFIFPIITGFTFFTIHLTGDLFGDEFLTYQRVLRINFFSFIDKPLYFFNNDALASVGYYLIGAPWSIRLHSVFFALLTIIMVGKLANLLLGRDYQLLAMWLAALSPILIEFGGEARPYATLTFLGTTFLFCLVKFEQCETWINAALLGAVSIVGCLYRMQFAAYLVFAAAYYLFKRKRITKFAVLGTLAATPLIWMVIESFLGYSPNTPKVPTGADPVSTVNFLLRTGSAFNFGYCTFLLPELGAARNVPVLTIVKQNWPTIFLCIIAAFGVCIGAVQFAKRQPRIFLFLLSFILLPTAGIIFVGLSGYAIIREKYLIAVLGPYLIFLSAIFKELIQKKIGWIPVISFFLVVAISLYNYTILPEKYSRRMMPSSLNQKIINIADKKDLIISYHISELEKIYFKFLDLGLNYIDIKEDVPAGVALNKYIEKIDKRKDIKIIIIYNEMRRNWRDPNNEILNYFKNRRSWKKIEYGRNLSLYIFERSNQLN